MPQKTHRVFRAIWWSANVLLLASAVSLVYAGAREYSVREYLKGFSDAVVPEQATPEQKVEAILYWMKEGPPRLVAANPSELSKRDPQTTLNYQQLLAVCGTSTNAFLNLARSAGLKVRRLLLLTPERTTKHVVAEVRIDGEWVIADPTYRVLLRGRDGHLLTRRDLQNPAVFAQATNEIPNYPRDYTYDHFAHVRLARLPLDALALRRFFNWIYPGWEEAIDWSLLLERESFLVLSLSVMATVLFVLLRLVLAWYADHRLKIPRFHLRRHMAQAGAAFLSTPEIKQ